MGMGTRGETAGRRGFQHFRKIQSNFLLLQVHQAEASQAGGVHDVSSAGEIVHLIEGGGMAALQVSIGNLPYPQVYGIVHRADERGFAHSGDSAEERQVAVTLPPQVIDAF